MKKKIGIWIDTKQAVIVILSKNHHTLKRLSSQIETRERVPGEHKKYGRFGNQYMTYEKNRINRRTQQTQRFFKLLIKELEHCESVVLFGPSRMKNEFAKMIKSTARISAKLVGIENSELLTENQMIAWVKNFYKIPLSKNKFN